MFVKPRRPGHPSRPGVSHGALQLPMPSVAMWQRRLIDTPQTMHNLVAAFDGVLMRVGLDLADNERAIALYRRFRFQVEGILRHYAFNQGRYMDAHVMGRINGQARPEPT